MLLSRPHLREALWITLLLAILCIVISTLQYYFVQLRLRKSEFYSLQYDARNIQEKLQITDKPNLEFFNKAYIDTGAYIAISDDGTVIEVNPTGQPRLPSIAPKVQMPWLNETSLGQIVSYTSPLGEHFLLVTTRFGAKYGVVGLSQYDNAADPKGLLLRNAALFSQQTQPGGARREDYFDNQINWAVVGSDGQLIADDGRLPFHVDPLIIGQQSAFSGYHDDKQGGHYFVLYSPLKKANGDPAGELIGYEDVTDEFAMLDDILRFSIWLAGASFVVFLALFGYSHLRKENEKLKLRLAFEKYFSPPILDAIMREPERLKPQRREVTVMFTDIRSFTELVEKLQADKLGQMMQQYFDEITGEIASTDGILDKYTGDGVMAFWGAPVDQPDQADRAVRAATGMLARLAKLNERWTAEGFPELDMGIGIHRGLATVGNFGSQKRVGYTAMGDVVNVAARLEALNKEFKSRIIISEAVRKELSYQPQMRDLGRNQIKGHAEWVRIYSVLMG